MAKKAKDTTDPKTIKAINKYFDQNQPNINDLQPAVGYLKDNADDSDEDFVEWFEDECYSVATLEAIAACRYIAEHNLLDVDDSGPIGQDVSHTQSYSIDRVAFTIFLSGGLAFECDTEY